ncbi:MAG: rod shape-determining protein MreC [Candidatus Zixiibacteriota bacterium]
MNWLSSVFPKYSRYFHYGLIVVLSVTLVLLPKKTSKPDRQPAGAYPVGAVKTTFYGPFELISVFLDRVRKTSADVEDLNAKLGRLSISFQGCEEVRLENVRLNRLLGFLDSSSHELIPAHVTHLSSVIAGVPESARINRGINHGVERMAAVISPEGGLVGRVVGVHPDWSTVQLLTDPEHRAAARITRSRETGIIRYVEDRGLILANVPALADVKENDTLITSGLGGVYPKSIFIGTVRSAQKGKEDTFCDIRVASQVNFRALEEVFVFRRL